MTLEEALEKIRELENENKLLKQNAEYNQKNIGVIERARVEEMKKRDKALEKLRQCLVTSNH